MQVTHVMAVIGFVWCVAGCGAYGDKHVYSAYGLVSATDLYQATLVVQKDGNLLKIYAYRVMGPDHIRLYITESENGSYIDTRRINGKWEENGGAIVINHTLD